MHVVGPMYLCAQWVPSIRTHSQNKYAEKPNDTEVSALQDLWRQFHCYEWIEVILALLDPFLYIPHQDVLLATYLDAEHLDRGAF
jgi:hypothetical protein